jgi:hypothetical protein
LIISTQRAIALKFCERFLNNVSRLFPVASYALSVLKKRNFESLYNLLNVLPCLYFPASHRFWHPFVDEENNTPQKAER